MANTHRLFRTVGVVCRLVGLLTLLIAMAIPHGSWASAPPRSDVVAMDQGAAHHGMTDTGHRQNVTLCVMLCIGTGSFGAADMPIRMAPAPLAMWFDDIDLRLVLAPPELAQRPPDIL